MNAISRPPTKGKSSTRSSSSTSIDYIEDRKKEISKRPTNTKSQSCGRASGLLDSDLTMAQVLRALPEEETARLDVKVETTNAPRAVSLA